MGEPKAPLKVFYCDPCSCPPEYCQYQDCFNKCKPWLLANCPFVDEIYPDLRNGEDSEELQKKVAELKVSGGTKTSGEEEEEVKKLPGGKIKKKEKAKVVIEKSTRNRRKAITIIRGLDMFGIKLSEASKLFGKKFASGSSIVKDPTGKEQIDVQGDFLFEAAEYIIKMYKDIPKSAIFLIEDNRKLGSAEDNL